MNLRQQLEQVNQKIDEIGQAYDDLGTRSFHLYEEKSSLIASIITEENLLKGSNWHLQLGRENWLVYDFAGNSPFDDSDPLKEVFDLIRSDYHSSFDLSEKIVIVFNDNEVFLTFKDSSDMLLFIQQHQLQVDVSLLTDYIIKLQKDLTTAERLYQQLGARVQSKGTSQ